MTSRRKYKILVVIPANTPPIDLASADSLAEVILCRDFARALQLVLNPELDAVVISAAQSSFGYAIQFARDLRALSQIPCVLVTWTSSEELAIDALNSGVSLFLKQPVSMDSVHVSLSKLLERRVPQSRTNGDVPLNGTEKLLGNSNLLRELREYIGRVSRCHSSVLITGETGTGKELVAELIHSNSPRRRNAFVCLNSTAIPDSLLESELFGYERGAFTGAVGTHRGKLALAHKGTLFFDEIGDISVSVQAKFLRAIEGKSVYRLGGENELAFDVRILSATNHDLDLAMRENRFRRDLYYRLNVIRIHVPPLRDRREDISVLLEHYIRQYNSSFGLRIEGFTVEALSQLVSYDWPGNVRELKNVVEAIFANLPSRRVDTAGLPACVAKYLCNPSKPAERDALLSALVATNWNKTRAADRLHWSRMTLYRKMAAYNIVRVTVAPQARVSSTKVAALQ